MNRRASYAGAGGGAGGGGRSAERGEQRGVRRLAYLCFCSSGYVPLRALALPSPPASPALPRPPPARFLTSMWSLSVRCFPLLVICRASSHYSSSCHFLRPCATDCKLFDWSSVKSGPDPAFRRGSQHVSHWSNWSRQDEVYVRHLDILALAILFFVARERERGS